MSFNLARAADSFEPPYTRAARQVIGQAFCANWETISGFWRGRFGVYGAWPAYIQAFRECGVDFGRGTSGEPGAGIDFRQEPPFTGGQCSGTRYRVEIFFRISDGQQGSPGATVYGPVKGLRLGPAPGNPSFLGLFLDAYDVDGNADSAYFGFAPSGQTWEEYRITSIVPLDGPDDCGDPDAPDNPDFPPVVPTPDPPPENPDGDPILIPSPGPVDVSVEFDGDTYEFSVSVGDITVNDEGDLQVDIDDRQWLVTPDLDIVGPDDLLKDLADDLLKDVDLQVLALQAQVEALRAQLQCVIADACAFEQYAYPVDMCDGTEVILQPGGVGNNKVVDVVIDTLLALNDNILYVCSQNDERYTVEDRELIYQSVVAENQEAGFASPADPDILFVDIEFTKIASPNKVYKLGPDGERQGRFGHFFQGAIVGNERIWSEPVDLWFEKNRVAIKKPVIGTLYLRVSSHVGNEFAVYDSGVRLL